MKWQGPFPHRMLPWSFVKTFWNKITCWIYSFGLYSSYHSLLQYLPKNLLIHHLLFLRSNFQFEFLLSIIVAKFAKVLDKTKRKMPVSFSKGLTREPSPMFPPKRVPPSPLFLQKTSSTFPDSSLTTSSCEESHLRTKEFGEFDQNKERREVVVFRNWGIYVKHQRQKQNKQSSQTMPRPLKDFVSLSAGHWISIFPKMSNRSFIGKLKNTYCMNGIMLKTTCWWILWGLYFLQTF